MTTTIKNDQFVPEIATEVATALFPNELALGFAGSPFVTAFPGADSLGEEGDTIKMPRYNALGDFAAMTEDVALTPERLRTSLDLAVVQAAGKAVEITDFATLAARGEPSEEVGRQVATLAARYIDQRFIDTAEAEASLTATYSQTLNWEVFVQAIISKWGDRSMESVGGVVIHSKVMGDIMILPEFKRADQLGQPGSIVRGFIGVLGTYPVYVSDRLTVVSGTPNTYKNLILKRGALGLKFQRQLLVEQDRDILKKNWVIAADVRFATHLFYGVPSPAILMVTQ